jgi:hypothetical protein
MFVARMAGAALLLVCLSEAAALGQVRRGADEIAGGFTLTTRKRASEPAATSIVWRVTYGRFVTDRLEIGPFVSLFKFPEQETYGVVGARVAYHVGPLDAPVIPVVDLSSGLGFGDPEDDPIDLQVLGGVKILFGGTGARLLIGPYYYRAFYDEERKGYDAFTSWGVLWNVGLLF